MTNTQSSNTEPITQPAADTGRQVARLTLIVIVSVFVIFMVFVVGLFKSGDEIHWKRELVEIEGIYNQGRYSEAAQRLLQFGRDRPGAQQTYNWNRQMGEYNAKAEQWRLSAQFYERALALRPNQPTINALAGEAHWNAGNREKALEHFRAEIDNTNPALGDHDRAFFHLGLHAFVTGDYRQALDHLASISDRDAWNDRIAPIRSTIDEEIIRPALARAEAGSQPES